MRLVRREGRSSVCLVLLRFGAQQAADDFYRDFNGRPVSWRASVCVCVSLSLCVCIRVYLCGCGECKAIVCIAWCCQAAMRCDCI